jgi:cation diffusion facilitator CzcD-associated flavoprotein CzcO
LTSVAHKYQLYKYVRFNTTVDEARWNGKERVWDMHVVVNGGKDSEYGGEYTVTSDFLISSVGQLNIPKYPHITGLNSFKGKTMHSARWDWNYPLGGKKIAIIGTGMSSFIQNIQNAANNAQEPPLLRSCQK